jgi:hypothetical protein
MAVLSAGAIAFLVFSGRSELSPEGTAVTNVAAPPVLPTMEPDQTAQAKAELELSDPEAAAEPTENAHPAVAPLETMEEPIRTSRPKKGSTKRPSKPKDSEESPAKKPPTDAWDPNNFGGRE